MKRAELAALGVSREAELVLHDFVRLLQRWNARINLTAERDEAAIWTRHVFDSLQLLPLLPETPGAMVDLGSGAGFPGLVLALVADRETHLVESDRRKAAFLIEAARVLGLGGVQVHPTRIEAAALPPTAIITARALAPLTDLLGHAHAILAPGGTAIFPKGRLAERELTDAAHAWIMRVERFPSRTDTASTIFRLSEIRPAGPHV